MSIATLKRKTQAKYNNMSVGQPQFSLNGTHRSQGYVGQTMLSRRLPTSLMKGNVIRGHGGCCGTYPIKPIVQSGINYQEDSRVVKSSVINNTGMIENKYYCVGDCVKGVNTCHGCLNRMDHVKPDSNNNNNSQRDYITSIANKAVSESENCKINNVVRSTTCDSALKMKRRALCTITKSDYESKIPMSSGQYIGYLVNVECSVNNALSKNPNPSMGRTIGC